MFAEIIKKRRTELQLPQRIVAAAMEVDTVFYSRMEGGLVLPTRNKVEPLAECLELKKDELAALWLADKINAFAATETVDVQRKALLHIAQQFGKQRR